MAAPKQLAEGEVKTTDLPYPPGAQMVQRVLLGLHSIEVRKLGVEVSKVYVRDYPHWESAFEAVMDKAGI